MAKLCCSPAPARSPCLCINSKVRPPSHFLQGKVVCEDIAKLCCALLSSITYVHLQTIFASSLPLLQGKVGREDIAELCCALLSEPAVADCTFEVKSTVPFSQPWQVRCL